MNEWQGDSRIPLTGLPQNYIRQPNVERVPAAPDDIKTPEQTEAERELSSFIASKQKTIFYSKKGDNNPMSSFIGSRGTGRYGLLLSPASGSNDYTLWFTYRRVGNQVGVHNYGDNVGDDFGELRIVSLDLTNKELQSVATCLEGEVVNSANSFPSRKTNKASKAEKLAVLIQNSSKPYIAVNDIDNESGFTRGYKVPPLESLLKKK